MELIVGKLHMVEQAVKLSDLFVHIIIGVFGINDGICPVQTDKTIGSGGTVYPAEGSLGAAVYLAFLNSLQGSQIRICRKSLWVLFSSI